MRRLILILAVLTAAVIALSSWQPGAVGVLPPTPTATLLPDDFTLIAPFTPSFPCELQNVEVRDEALCRSERVQERVLAQGETAAFSTITIWDRAVMAASIWTFTNCASAHGTAAW